MSGLPRNIAKNLAHHLKSATGIHQTKQNPWPLKEIKRSYHHRLWNFSFGHRHLIVALGQIQLGKNRITVEAGDKISNVEVRVSIRHCLNV